jgi:hypothetical protein
LEAERRVGGNLIWGLTCHGTPAICLLHEDERSLELAIDLDALIAVVMQERSEEQGVPPVPVVSGGHCGDGDDTL